MPETFVVQATHEDIVERPPEGATVLAGNENTAVQALAFGPRIRGSNSTPRCIRPPCAPSSSPGRRSWRPRPPPGGQSPAERVPRLLAGITPAPAGHAILRNFLERFT
ncbi:hypothetical protein ACN28S_43285 [Cystobacter fuscus]